MSEMGDGAEHSIVGPTASNVSQYFSFVRSGDQGTQELDWDKGPDKVRKALGEALGARNVAFLLGAGCSSMMKDGTECGIATMAPLAAEFCGAAGAAAGGNRPEPGHAPKQLNHFATAVATCTVISLHCGSPWLSCAP